NFVALAGPTPGGENALPLVGPLILSEIMYHPVVGLAEYIEITNISGEVVPLFDTTRESGWRITQGVTFEFPRTGDIPLSLHPGERLLLVRDESAFREQFAVPAEVGVFVWPEGALNNGGEKLELSRPGDVDDEGLRQYVRVDRVNYEDGGAWPVEADGTGWALHRLNEAAYGNDPANWMAGEPHPGAAELERSDLAFSDWIDSFDLSASGGDLESDPDQDGLNNWLEWAVGTSPLETSELVRFRADSTNRIGYMLPELRTGLDYRLEISADLREWRQVATRFEKAAEGWSLSASVSPQGVRSNFYRLKILMAP
ncbi:MAG: lamin tail domain-containing protein, partial [Verrucomicrobiota bacterium]